MRIVSEKLGIKSGQDVAVVGEACSGKSSLLKKLVKKYEQSLGSSSWKSDDDILFKPSHPAIAPTVRITNPNDTVLWYNIFRICSYDEASALSTWYYDSIINEVKSVKDSVVMIDDADLFSDDPKTIQAVLSACSQGGNQTILTIRKKSNIPNNMVVVDLNSYKDPII